MALQTYRTVHLIFVELEKIRIPLYREDQFLIHVHVHTFWNPYWRTFKSFRVLSCFIWHQVFFYTSEVYLFPTEERRKRHLKVVEGIHSSHLQSDHNHERRQSNDSASIIRWAHHRGMLRRNFHINFPWTVSWNAVVWIATLLSKMISNLLSLDEDV